MKILKPKELKWKQLQTLRVKNLKYQWWSFIDYSPSASNVFHGNWLFSISHRLFVIQPIGFHKCFFRSPLELLNHPKKKVSLEKFSYSRTQIIHHTFSKPS